MCMVMRVSKTSRHLRGTSRAPSRLLDSFRVVIFRHFPFHWLGLYRLWVSRLLEGGLGIRVDHLSRLPTLHQCLLLVSVIIFLIRVFLVMIVIVTTTASTAHGSQPLGHGSIIPFGKTFRKTQFMGSWHRWSSA